MLSPEILEYYERGGERLRLTAGTGRLEFLRTWDVLTRVLPPTPARIVDVGGATGVYARPLAEAGYAEPEFVSIVDRAPGDGVHRNAGAESKWFTSAYFHRPDEPAAEAAEAGLDATRTVAVEGPVWMTGTRLTDFLADERLTGIMLDKLRRVEDEPSLLGASSHLLTTARRPAP